MPREIQIPPFLSKVLSKVKRETIEWWVRYNDDVLLSQCRNKPPKFGVITLFGIEWQSFDDLKKDVDQACHEFFHLIIVEYRGKIYALAHSDEIYNLRIHPYINQPLE